MVGTVSRPTKNGRATSPRASRGAGLVGRPCPSSSVDSALPRRSTGPIRAAPAAGPADAVTEPCRGRPDGGLRERATPIRFDGRREGIASWVRRVRVSGGFERSQGTGWPGPGVRSGSSGARPVFFRSRTGFPSGFLDFTRTVAYSDSPRIRTPRPWSQAPPHLTGRESSRLPPGRRCRAGRTDRRGASCAGRHRRGELPAAGCALLAGSASTYALGRSCCALACGGPAEGRLNLHVDCALRSLLRRPAEAAGRARRPGPAAGRGARRRCPERRRLLRAAPAHCRGGAPGPGAGRAIRRPSARPRDRRHPIGLLRSDAGDPRRPARAGPPRRPIPRRRAHEIPE